MLCAIDFWVTKNIVGRKLVKLRWWYTIDDGTGNERWIFESKSIDLEFDSIRECNSSFSR